MQKVKLAAVEAEYNTHPAPAPFTVFGIPNDEKEQTEYALQIPWAMGIIATRSLTEEVKGIKDLKEDNKLRILDGIKAYEVLDDVRNGTATAEQRATFETHKGSLGYAMLLEPFTTDVTNPSDAALQQAVDYSIPPVAPLFWSFRLMVASGFIMLALFICAFYFSTKHKITKPRWLLKASLYSLPLPWIASEAGWFVAEYGRQPWSIAEVLPVHASVSNLAVSDVVITLVAYSAFYTVMFIAAFYLMKKFAKKGPVPPSSKPAYGELEHVDTDYLDNEGQGANA